MPETLNTVVETVETNAPVQLEGNPEFVANEATPATDEPVLVLKHDPTNHVNVRNNRAFCKVQGLLCEVVRRGRKQWRVRQDLNGNGDTKLVPVGDCSDYDTK